jgi:hypothetical protein
MFSLEVGLNFFKVVTLHKLKVLESLNVLNVLAVMFLSCDGTTLPMSADEMCVITNKQKPTDEGH